MTTRRSPRPGPRRAPLALATVLVIACVALGGCLERRLFITSDPPGADVWVNDAELGRTPLQADFKFYGEYDVRLRLAGHEPVSTKALARAPWYEWMGPDLIAEAWPAPVVTEVKWHFTLKPSAERTMEPADFERGLLERARELQQRTTTPPAPSPTPPAERESRSPG